MRRTVQYYLIIMLAMLVTGSLATLAFAGPGASDQAPTATPAASTATLSNITALKVVNTYEIDIPKVPFDTNPVLAPDGQRFAYQQDKTLCIYTIQGVRQVCATLTFSPNPLFRWSPDSQKILLTGDFFYSSDESDLWVMDANTGNLQNLTDDGVVGGMILNSANASANANVDVSANWLSDSQNIVFRRYPVVDGQMNAAVFYRLNLSSGELTPLFTPFPGTEGVVLGALAPLPDGQRLAYTRMFGNGNPDDGVWLADMGGQHAQRAFSLFVANFIDFSADKRYLLVSIPYKGAERFTPEESQYRVIDLQGSTMLIDPDHFVHSAGWSPSGSALAYVVDDPQHPDAQGLYVTQQPGILGRMILPGKFWGLPAYEYQLIWSSNNMIMLSGPGGRPITVVQLG
jgi:hypothetical protein